MEKEFTEKALQSVRNTLASNSNDTMNLNMALQAGTIFSFGRVLLQQGRYEEVSVAVCSSLAIIFADAIYRTMWNRCVWRDSRAWP